jgi:hypothetical protein
VSNKLISKEWHMESDLIKNNFGTLVGSQYTTSANLPLETGPIAIMQSFN